MNKTIEKRRYPKIFLFFLLILTAGFLGFLLGRISKPVYAVRTQSVRENTSDYKFIHPLLVVNSADNSVLSSTYKTLENNILSFIQIEKNNGSLLDTSVYFIDYKKNGGLISINADEKYPPASMLKVVIMIGYMKEADSNPEIMNQKLVYNTTLANELRDTPFDAPSTLVVGQSYTIKDLIQKMIVSSDNGAMNLLLNNIDDSYLSEVYKELGLQGPDNEGSDYMISAHDYSLFFRVLYNATYLSRNSSEEALSLLSQATFKDGLVSGVPQGIVVAHKFGEHINGSLDNVSSVELHDCGYVYASDAPYFLCVMTRSANLNESEKVISTISKMVYNAR